MKDTPVSIPNTEVKLQNADSSWRNASCEGRKLPCLLIWRISSVGRASALQAGGHRFEPYNFHQFLIIILINTVRNTHAGMAQG